MDKNQLVLYEDYLRMIRELADTAHTIAKIQEEKAVAAAQRRHELLDSYMKKEQSCILKLRGLDQHRERLAKSLGWDRLNFSQILEKVEPARRENLKGLFGNLEQELRFLLQSREVAGRIMDIRVYECLITVRQRPGVLYDRGRKMEQEGFHTNLCDRYG